MLERTKPPFRADHVGSLIRPAELIAAREKSEKKEISEAEPLAEGKRAGLLGVKVVSVSETHTAEKFVIPGAKRQRREKP